MKGRRVSYEATVVVPVLNQRRSWLRQCIVSACTQSAPVETIVVTSPRTRASTIQELRELRRKYGSVRVLPEEGEGFAAALNTGIRAADGVRILEQVSRTTSLEQFRRLPSLERKASYLQHFFLFEKSVLREVGGVDEQIGLTGPDDFDMIWTLLERGASVSIVPAQLYNYRDH